MLIYLTLDKCQGFTYSYLPGSDPVGIFESNDIISSNMSEIPVAHLHELYQQLKPLMVFDATGDVKATNFEGTDWKLNSYHKGDCKLTVVNEKEGIFIKQYTPDTQNFTQIHFGILQQLTAISGLSIPILRPLAVEEQCLIFPLGKKTLFQHYSHTLPPVIHQQMSLILTPHHLKLSPKIDIVKVKGQEFYVDIVEDTADDVYRALGIWK